MPEPWRPEHRAEDTRGPCTTFGIAQGQMGIVARVRTARRQI